MVSINSYTMIDQLSWLGKKEEVALAKTKFRGKLAGKSWEFERNVNGLIRTRAVILIMSLLVFYPILTNYLAYDFFSIGLLIERLIFSLLLLAAFFLFNKSRPLAIVLAMIPIILIILTYLTGAGQFDIRTVGFLVAVLGIIAAGFYHDAKVNRLRKELEANLLENQLIDRE